MSGTTTCAHSAYLRNLRTQRQELQRRGKWTHAARLVLDGADKTMTGAEFACGQWLRHIVDAPGMPSADKESLACAGCCGQAHSLGYAVKSYQLASSGVQRDVAVAFARRALELANRRDADAVWYATLTLIYAEELELAGQHCAELAESRTWLSAHGNPERLAALRARVLALSGHPRNAATLLRKVVLRSGSPALVVVATVWLVEVLAELGEFDEASDLLEPGGVTDVGVTPLDTAFTLAARGSLDFATGRFRRSLEHFMACGRILTALGICNSAVIRWRSKASVSAFALDRNDLAIVLARRELENTETWGTAWLRGQALHALALVQRDEHSLPRLRKAAVIASTGPVRSERGQVYYDLGTVLAERSAKEEARGAYAVAQEVAAAHQNPVLLDRAGEAIERLTGTHRATALTPQENRVARLARAGQSNREIAGELHLSVGTVEQHLSNAYRKLGISGRADLSYAMA
ncbi:response regulator transcription factor [Actinophytocola sediminis]